MAEEQVFSDQNVSITTARVVVSGTTYALRNITSIKMSTTFTPAKQGGAATLLLIGILAFAVMLVKFSSNQLAESLVKLLVPGALVFGAIMWMRSIKSTTDYHVSIASSSGETHALTSKDKSYIEKIVASINDAIVLAK